MYFLTILIKAATGLSCSIILRVWISHVVGAVELAKEPRVAVAVVHAHLGRKKYDLGKKIHKWRKKLGWKKTYLSRGETAGVTIGRSASLASFFSTHRWGKNGEQKQERKAFHFSVNVWKLLGETKYWYEKVSLSFSLLPKTEKKLLFHFSSFSKLRISCCLSPCLSKNVLLSLREYTYTSFDWIASYLLM